MEYIFQDLETLVEIPIEKIINVDLVIRVEPVGAIGKKRLQNFLTEKTLRTIYLTLEAGEWASVDLAKCSLMRITE